MNISEDAYDSDMDDSDTSVRIKEDTWQRLNDRKKPGKSFDQIINELLDEVEGRDEATPDC